MIMKPVTLISDLSIENGDMQFTVKSDADQIVIWIEGDRIPKLEMSIRKLLAIKKSIPFETDQTVTVFYKEKEIYQSDRSLFTRFDYFFLLKFLLKNRF